MYEKDINFRLLTEKTTLVLDGTRQLFGELVTLKGPQLGYYFYMLLHCNINHAHYINVYTHTNYNTV